MDLEKPSTIKTRSYSSKNETKPPNKCTIISCRAINSGKVDKFLWVTLYILKIDGKQNSEGKELVIECHLGLLHDFSRFLYFIINYYSIKSIKRAFQIVSD